jgi:hypothetical protein
MDIEKRLFEEIADSVFGPYFTPPTDAIKVKVVPTDPCVSTADTTTKDYISESLKKPCVSTADVATKDYVGESLEKTRDYVNERIEEYDRNRLFSDEDLLIFLKDKILEEREKERKEFEDRVNKMKRHTIDDFINRDIKRVIFNDNATIVIWKDNTKTVVKCQPGETFDKEKGLALCIIKHQFGDIGYYNEIFKKLIKKDEED